MCSVAFILAAIILGSREGEKPLEDLLNITMCSLDVDISTVRNTASDKGQERCYPCKHAVSFASFFLLVASRLTIFAALLRTMNRSNAKLANFLYVVALF